VPLSLSAADVAWLDRLVVEGGYPSRAAVLASIVHSLAEDDRAREALRQPVAHAA
jgi:Arc/MetJ-type ribon-helix-helix transcriptional regulator